MEKGYWFIQQLHKKCGGKITVARISSDKIYKHAHFVCEKCCQPFGLSGTIFLSKDFKDVSKKDSKKVIPNKPLC